MIQDFIIFSFLIPFANTIYETIADFLKQLIWSSVELEARDEFLQQITDIFGKYFDNYKSDNYSLDFVSGWCFYDGLPFYLNHFVRENKCYNGIRIGTFRCFRSYLFKCIKQIKNECDKNKVYVSINDTWYYVDNIFRSFDNIFIDPHMKADLLNDIDRFKNNKKIYEINGIKWKRTYLFYGKPGTGKTSTIIAIATYLNLNIYYFNRSTLIEDTNFIHAILNINKPAILVFEDLESILKTVETNNNYAELLNFLDGMLTPNHIIIVTSNNPEQIDKTILRSGRIDKILYFDLPSKEIINDMLKYYKVTEDVEKFIGKSQAEIINIIWPKIITEKEKNIIKHLHNQK